MRRYDGMNREDLIAELEKVNAELILTRTNRNSYESAREDYINEKGPNTTKWRRTDEHYRELNDRVSELHKNVQILMDEAYDLRRELERDYVATHGGCDRNHNYYDTYDKDLYLVELTRYGVISGFTL